MACEHSETTVLLHLFGEAPSWYAGHLAGCADCQDALAEHAVTVGVVEGALRKQPDVQEGPTLEHEAVTGADVEVIPLRSAGTGRRVALWAAAVAAVLALAVGVGVALTPEPPTPVADAPVVPLEPWVDPIAAELDMLDAELDALSREMEDL
jgi:hypothetical protein